MGDWAQRLVDLEVTGAAAVEAAQRLTEWLVARGIVLEEVTDCVLGGPGGHPPGDNYALAVGDPAAVAPVLWTNGAEIRSGREVQWTLDMEAVTCPRCGYRETLEPRVSRWDTAFHGALDRWLNGGDPGTIACLGCGAAHGLNDWDWGENPWAFGELAVTFWNWHPLSAHFIAETTEFLDHRVIYNSYKL